ncbi:MAG TPA: SgcJ/EcaC family oxidoreductase [Thermoguttaceae bacterium]|nr:SgcJ/EcaC family oxidoreductase [Thermoguttaceae bacterium]
MKPSVSACLLSWAIVSLGLAAAPAQETGDDKAAIEAAVESYVKAFNARDAKALAEHWSPEGVYTSRLGGEQITGRDALAEEFAAQFEASENTKLEVATESIEFLSPNVALERGTATVTEPEAEPVKSEYTAVYVQREGRWLIDRVSEEEKLPAPPSHFGQLEDLDWMVGDWIDREGGEAITTQCQWTRNRNFLVRAFMVSIEDRVDVTGMEFVGWDPARKQIRSWVFDSDGGFAEGSWSRSGDRWLVKTKATLPDGRIASSTSILRPLDEDSFTWQQVNRVVGGQLLPNIDEVVIVRQP